MASGDYTPLGGMDRANHALALSLAARGDELELVTHRAWPDLHRNGVVVTPVPRPFGAHLLGTPLLSAIGGSRVRRARPGTRVIVNGGNVDTRDITWIHYLHAAHVPDARGVAAGLKERGARQYYLARERRVVRAARYVICNSRRTAADVTAAYDVPPERTRVVYYGVDPEAFAPVDPGARESARRALGLPAQGPVVLFVGALGDRRKGFDRLFEAWASLAREGGWGALLVAAGAGRELPRWRARAAHEGLASVRFLGFRPDIPTVMAAGDVIVHPARYEAYGLGVHEAICRGIPAIVSARAGVAEQLGPDFEPLLIADVESAAEIAARLRTWRNDMERFRGYAAGAGARLRARTWSGMAADFTAAVDA